MARQQASQKYIFKIHSTRLKKAKWNLTLPLSEARRNDEVISLNDSQMLRWIDELNGVVDAEERVAEIKSQIRMIRKRQNTKQNRSAIRDLYAELDRVQFKPDYLHLIIDKDKDLLTACKGFKVNGIKYVRLLGTNGGVKASTIVFVSERLAPTLRSRINNGRNMNIPMIPAKFEAYRALTCSGSIPVSLPHGILVVPDCETKFKEDIIMLNDENGGEPEMTYIKDYEITLDESDGYGLMLPSLAERWSQELHLNYIASGMNTRFSWEKGMVFTFDFAAFADEVAGAYIVKDAWGHDVDIRNVELILTTSMLKLWNCYDSMDHYLSCCAENHYTFGVTKTCPAELESWRNLNYQFIQSYHLTDEQIDELIQPTLEELRDSISGDYRKALLFLHGKHLTPESIHTPLQSSADALMIEPKLFDDTFIKKRIFRLMERRISDAKIGVVGVHGNYSIVCGDPYALCQSIFGLPVTGLLSAGQIYNRYWVDRSVNKVACFRAPMSTHENIAAMEVADNNTMQYWYRYMKTCTMINAWDTLCQKLNGMDKDGDLIFTTDNRVLVDNIRPMPTIFCVQRKGENKIVTEDDLVKANIASFGDDIGKTTNYITSMYDVQAQFEPGSREYETLSYRIRCGQLYQQNCIDKAKGILCKPMPRYWYDFHAANSLPDNPSEEDLEYREFNLRILADKKPYFMRYIYPAVMQQYNTYIKNTNTKALMEFTMPMDDLLRIESATLTPEQEAFVRYYVKRIPVGMNDCVMNRICRKFEAQFDGKLKVMLTSDFDYAILKGGCEYTRSQYEAIQKLYTQHTKQVKEFSTAESKSAVRTNQSAADKTENLDNLTRTFRRDCLTICSSEDQVCDIALDICYKREGTKSFAWDLFSKTICQHLLEKNNYMISFPVHDDNGDIVYGGCRYSMKTMRIEYERDCIERAPLDRECDEQLISWCEAG